MYRKQNRFNTDITRRDFLNGVAAGVGVALAGGPAASWSQASLEEMRRPGADWYGYGGVGSWRHSHGNTPEVVTTAHSLRDGQY
ncbi:MAG: twin-arginine translocation signal domain-containing protein, partial [Woeseiaceae bacterium]|nr:twin-arginine translocation signal domain-containing protein [Woeseiaceae bacterium]